jgi:hypothetical protein
MRAELLSLDHASYENNPLHREDRVWQETNCYVDLWIEVLHGLGLDVNAALAFTLNLDFQGDQWAFFKFPLEDLRALYGIDVNEMNVWRPLEHHVAEQLGLGRMMTIEVDSWYLPDTAGVSYQIEHVKTSIATNMIDPDARHLGYFHGSGYYEVSGADFDGLFHLDAPRPERLLPPYVELIRLDDLRRPTADDLTAAALSLAEEHLARRALTNPFGRFRKRFEDDVNWLREQDIETFHHYAFANLRQCGACAELAASFLEWLDGRGVTRLTGGVEPLRTIAATAKTVQFKLARMAAGREVDVTPLLDDMERGWDAADAVLTRRHGV